VDYIRFARGAGIDEHALSFSGHALREYSWFRGHHRRRPAVGRVIAFAIITETVFQCRAMDCCSCNGAKTWGYSDSMAAYLMMVFA